MDDDPADRGRVRQVDRADVDRRALARPAWIPRSGRPTLRAALGLGGLVQAVDECSKRAADRALAGRREESARKPEVEQQDRQGCGGGADEQQALDAEPAEEDVTEADTRVPDRVRPQLEAEHGHDDDEQPKNDREGEDDLAPKARPAVARTTDGATSAGPPGRSTATSRAAAGEGPDWLGLGFGFVWVEPGRIVVRVVGRRAGRGVVGKHGLRIVGTDRILLAAWRGASAWRRRSSFMNSSNMSGTVSRV